MSLPTNYIRINCNGPFHFISAPPPPLLRVKEILGGGRGPLAVISEGVAMKGGYVPPLSEGGYVSAL